MRISEINEGVSLLANIGVIASIVFLGLEMQQNTEMMQSQTRNSIVEHQLSFYERVVDHKDFAQAAADFRLDANAYSEGAAEDLQYRLWIISQLRMWENEFYQFQAGLYDSDEFEPRTNVWRRQIAIAATEAVWRRTEDSFAPNFRNYLNGIIAEMSL